MAKSKNSLFYLYLASIGVFALLAWWITRAGEKLEALPSVPVEQASPWGSFQDTFLSAMHHPVAMLILQIITILLVARVFIYLTGKIGQPLVVGEIVAGIFLGPSFLGFLFPDVFYFLFPPASLNNLQFLSQLGLIFFMFIIGMDLDIKSLKNRAHEAIVVSHASIVVPFLLGMLLAYMLFSEYAPAGTSFIGFALFIGIAMSITAFPVLARIIQERGLSKTPLGTMAITCAAADDITAWCILAAVIAIIKAGSMISALFTIALAVGYVAFMLLAVRPVMHRIGAIYASREILNKRVVGIVFLMLLGSAYVAEVIGIHALFGAFLAGVIMPPNLSFKKIITEKIEDISLVLLLPLFFVFVGLRTQIGSLDNVGDWLICLLVLVVAVAGKMGGSTLAARAVGQSWKNSLSLGVLMNTRGLMELVVLNIGYELGVLTPEIFTMMVIMALGTTFLTGPGLGLIDKIFREKDFANDVLSRIKPAFRILISFGPPRMGSTLLRLADQLTLKTNSSIEVTALHITPSSEVKPYDALFYEKEGFQSVKSTAQLLGVKLNTLYRNTEDIDKEIAYTVKQGKYDLVLVGAARSMFNDRVTGGKLRQLIEEQSNLGILIDRGFVMAESILLLLGSKDDLFLLQYARRFRTSNRARVTVLKVGDAQSVDLNDAESPYYSFSPSFQEVIEQRIPDKHLLNHFNLVLVSIDHWNNITAARATWIKECPSILVVKHFQDLASDTADDEVMLRKSLEEGS